MVEVLHFLYQTPLRSVETYRNNNHHNMYPLPRVRVSCIFYLNARMCVSDATDAAVISAFVPRLDFALGSGNCMTEVGD